jgi:type IV secretory pathway VirB10-like protein
MMSEPQPTVQKKSAFPMGAIPKSRSTWIMCVVAVLVVGGVLLSPQAAPTSAKGSSEKAPAATPPVRTLTNDDIARARKELDQQTEMLRLSQERAARSQAELEAQMRGIPPPQGGAPAYAPNAPMYYQAPPAAPQPAPDPIKEELKKREHLSLYASNVALSYRPQSKREETNPAPDEPNSVKPAEPSPKDETTTPKSETPGSGKYKLFEGTIIEAALMNQLEGDFAGPVICLVTTDVPSHDRQRVLIPKGSRILGMTEEVQESNQRRLAVIFHRIIMPDGFSVDLEKTAGLDQIGATALKDKVNNHIWSKIATAGALGLIGGLSLYNTGGYNDANGSDMYRQGVAREMGQGSRTILQHQLNRMPEITIRPGNRVKVWLAKDIYLPAYDEHPKVPGV